MRSRHGRPAVRLGAGLMLAAACALTPALAWADPHPQGTVCRASSLSATPHEVRAGETVTLEGCALEAGGTVQVDIVDVRSFRVVADADGTFSQDVVLPRVPEGGEQHIQMRGQNAQDTTMVRVLPSEGAGHEDPEDPEDPVIPEEPSEDADGEGTPEDPGAQDPEEEDPEQEAPAGEGDSDDEGGPEEDGGADPGRSEEESGDQGVDGAAGGSGSSDKPGDGESVDGEQGDGSTARSGSASAAPGGQGSGREEGASDEQEAPAPSASGEQPQTETDPPAASEGSASGEGADPAGTHPALAALTRISESLRQMGAQGQAPAEHTPASDGGSDGTPEGASDGTEGSELAQTGSPGGTVGALGAAAALGLGGGSLLWWSRRRDTA